MPGGGLLLTSRVLWPWLRSTGMSEAEVRNRRFWPDADKAALGLNRADMARQLYLLNELNPEALRDAHGFDESHAPTEVQVIRGLGVKLSIPAMAAYKMNVPPEILVAPSSPPPGRAGTTCPRRRSTPAPRWGTPTTGSIGARADRAGGRMVAPCLTCSNSPTTSPSARSS